MTLEIPKTSRRALFFIAAFVWTFAGSLLLIKGFNYFENWKNHYWLVLASSILTGIAFYIFVFSKISSKHTSRISKLDSKSLYFYSFFNIKSYFLMTIMIGLGILLRTTGFVPVKYLAIVYIAMGIPLFLSALQFYFSAYYYREKSD